jgi:hypothetical protein
MASSPRTSSLADAAARYADAPLSPPTSGSSSFEGRRRPPPPLELNRQHALRPQDTQVPIDASASRPVHMTQQTQPSLSSRPSSNHVAHSDASSSLEPAHAHGAAGLGLVLPYLASQSSSTNPSPEDSLNTHDAPASPLGRRASTSPSADRSRLIGLGELATPRWTAKETNSKRESLNFDDWEFDVVKNYGNEMFVSNCSISFRWDTSEHFSIASRAKPIVHSTRGLNLGAVHIKAGVPSPSPNHLHPQKPRFRKIPHLQFIHMRIILIRLEGRT